MRQQPLQFATSSPFALGLALAALLFMSALQAIELSHQHQLGDTAEHCLVCKAESASIPAPESLPEAVVSRLATLRVAAVRLAFSQLLSLPPARGPPVHA